MPKFLLMVNHDNGVVNGPMSEWEPDEVRAHMNYYEILGRELTESGEQIQFMALADPRLARIVRSDGTSAPVVTDGPFPESKEVLAGFQVAVHWARDGIPDKPRGWLLQTAARRFTDLARSEQARRRREERAAREPPPGAVPAHDDTLVLLFLCCHPLPATRRPRSRSTGKPPPSRPASPNDGTCWPGRPACDGRTRVAGGEIARGVLFCTCLSSGGNSCSCPA